MILKKVNPNRFVYHVTSETFRDQIFRNGLIGKSSLAHVNFKNPIFAHNLSVPNLNWYPFVLDSIWNWDTMDDFKLLNTSQYDYLKLQCMTKGYDFWQIDTRKLKNKQWFIDEVATNEFLNGINFPYYIVSEGNIPSYAIKLYTFHEEPSIKFYNGVAHIESDFRSNVGSIK
jgi:hypothetical protein